MKKRRKSYSAYIIMICVIVISLFYESFQPRNIETITIISGVGLEKGENKAIKMTVQMIKPEKGDAGSSTSSCIVLTGEGDSVAEASEDIILKTGSVLFWAHCSVILLQSDFAANEDVVPHLDMFFRSTNFRNTASIIVCDEAPADIFNANTVFEMVSSFGIQRLLDDQDYESNSVYMSLKKFVKNYYMLSSSSVVAGVTTEEVNQYSEKNEKGDSGGESTVRTIILSPCAIMRNGKFISYLSDPEFNGYKWLVGSMDAKIVSLNDVDFEFENNTIGLSLFAVNSKLTPLFEDGKYVLKVSIKVKAEVISVKNELETKALSPYKLEKRYDEYNRIVRGEICNEIDSTWAKMIDTESDYCNIQDLFYGKFGNDWKQNRPESDSDMLSQIKLEYDIDVNVVSGGLNKRFRLKEK